MTESSLYDGEQQRLYAMCVAECTQQLRGAFKNFPPGISAVSTAMVGFVVTGGEEFKKGLPRRDCASAIFAIFCYEALKVDPCISMSAKSKEHLQQVRQMYLL